MRNSSIRYLLTVWLICCILTGCERKQQYYVSAGANHTYYKITYQYTEPIDAEIGEAFRSYYHSINPFDSLSIISAVNNNKNMTVDSIFINAFLIAEDISEQTGGAFDITCAPLLNLWGFGFSKMDSVTPQLVDSLRAFVGYDKVSLQGNTIIKKDPRVMLNFSALGDGYICDIIADLLESKGIENYLVDIGGEMRIKGVNPSNQPWTIGINRPVDDKTQLNNEIELILKCSDQKGIATSGDYRNFYIKDGKKYAHTIDPHTGYPAGQDILSATVIADQGTVADAYATAFMVLGRQKAKELYSLHPELEYLFIYSDSTGDYRWECSEGMNKYLADK